MEALRSTDPAYSPTVSPVCLRCSKRKLAKAPAVHGFDDQRWTLARVPTVIRRFLRVGLSVATVWRLLKRHGWSWQAPTRRALERDEHAVELWKREVWPRAKASRRLAGPGSSSRTKPASRCPASARTWGQRGHTPCHPCPWQVPPPDLGRRPVLRQTRREKPSHPPPPHPPPTQGHPQEHSPEKDYRDLLVRAHIQPDGPIASGAGAGRAGHLSGERAPDPLGRLRWRRIRVIVQAEKPMASAICPGPGEVDGGRQGRAPRPRAAVRPGQMCGRLERSCSPDKPRLGEIDPALSTLQRDARFPGNMGIGRRRRRRHAPAGSAVKGHPGIPDFSSTGRYFAKCLMGVTHGLEKLVGYLEQALTTHGWGQAVRDASRLCRTSVRVWKLEAECQSM
ncbi:winged helix-turn-helix domain-containing protein [Streptomyces sp900105245]|uniref:Winged helix-turn-helix domain-containing protein n=1 Tax=Streptomyces sp. 900105245 TaxID=3154379 RepID=A0ABV1UML4_9ACTN